MDTVIVIRADNQGAIAIAKDFKASAATRHIATAYHLTRDYISHGVIGLSYIPTALMVPDGMTKALGLNKHKENCVM